MAMSFKQKIKILLFLLNSLAGLLAAIFLCNYIAKTSKFQNDKKSSDVADKLLTTSYYAILIITVIILFALSIVGFICIFMHCKQTNQRGHSGHDNAYVNWVKGWLYTRCFDFIGLSLSIFSGTSFLWLLLLENKSELMQSGINDPMMR